MGVGEMFYEIDMTQLPWPKETLFGSTFVLLGGQDPKRPLG